MVAKNDISVCHLSLLSSWALQEMSIMIAVLIVYTERKIVDI